MGAWIRRIGIAPVLFVAVFCIHFASGVGAGGDSRWVVPTAVSIYTEGNTDLNEYPDLLEEWDYYCIDKVDNRFYSFFPIGTTVLALPSVFATDMTMRAAFAFFPGLESVIRRMSPRPVGEVTVLTVALRVEWLVADFIVALTTVLFYWVGRRYLRAPFALLLALLFAFATPAWSTASRALLQHGPMMLTLALPMYLFIAAEKRPWMVQFAGAVLAFGYVIRPTGSIPLLLLSLYVLVKHRRYVLAYAGWAAVVLLCLFAYHYAVYGAILPPYYRAGRLGSSPYFWEALAGNLISPSRGLLLFTPLFLFSFVGVYLKLRRGEFGLLDALLCGIAALHYLAISAFPHWWGGHSYGPRYFSDVVPVFVYFLIPVLQRVQDRPPATEAKCGRRSLIAAFALSAVLSFVIHGHGATDMRGYNWNWDPLPIDEHPERLWSWNDPQFLRGLVPRGNAVAADAPDWENARMSRQSTQPK